ncbi:hypothetical protein Leryth_023824, partial [Lithospermum erythrorhizon]
HISLFQILIHLLEHVRAFLNHHSPIQIHKLHGKEMATDQVALVVLPQQSYSGLGDESCPWSFQRLLYSQSSENTHWEHYNIRNCSCHRLFFPKDRLPPFHIPEMFLPNLPHLV